MDIADSIKHRCKLRGFSSYRHMTSEDTGRMQVRIGSEIAIKSFEIAPTNSPEHREWLPGTKVHAQAY